MNKVLKEVIAGTVDLEYSYYKLKCSKCGRKILVEAILAGTDHNVDLIVTCAECIKPPFNEEFVRKYPDIAKDIESWIREG